MLKAYFYLWLFLDFIKHILQIAFRVEIELFMALQLDLCFDYFLYFDDFNQYFFNFYVQGILLTWNHLSILSISLSVYIYKKTTTLYKKKEYQFYNQTLAMSDNLMNENVSSRMQWITNSRFPNLTFTISVITFYVM